ncbi:MAG: hypothetical protein RIC16_09230 [Rhodospirillales bacterium]
MISLFPRREPVQDIVSPWSYLSFASDTPPEKFGDLAPIVELWRSKWPAPDRFPAWRNFDILEFRGWWGQLSLAEMHRDPLDLRWALWGTKLTHWWGADYTGQRISEQPHLMDVWQHFERPYFECQLEHRLIGFVTGSLEPQDRQFLNIRGIDLPLETDGVLTHYLSVYELRHADDNFVPDAPVLFRF